VSPKISRPRLSCGEWNFMQIFESIGKPENLEKANRAYTDKSLLRRMKRMRDLSSPAYIRASRHHTNPFLAKHEKI
jgi:hypothetical protein